MIDRSDFIDRSLLQGPPGGKGERGERVSFQGCNASARRGVGGV